MLSSPSPHRTLATTDGDEPAAHLRRRHSCHCPRPSMAADVQSNAYGNRSTRVCERQSEAVAIVEVVGGHNESIQHAALSETP